MPIFHSDDLSYALSHAKSLKVKNLKIIRNTTQIINSEFGLKKNIDDWDKLIEKLR